MTRLLASVRSVAEAAMVLEAADIIDVKEPSAGALGRLEPPELAAIVRFVARRRPVSATIGDLPLEPASVVAATRSALSTGVDFAKIGLFDGDRVATFAALRAVIDEGARLVAVILADRPFEPDLIEVCRAAGFVGVMLDTADKRAGPLSRHRPRDELARITARARSLGLMSGLAGSLGLADIAPLAGLAPDYLGFRSALCVGAREGDLDPARIQAARERLDAANSANATAGAAPAARSPRSPDRPNSVSMP